MATWKFNSSISVWKKFDSKVQTCLELMITTFTDKINMIIYFENLIIGLHVLYILNTYVKFRVNRILFTIRFMHNIILPKKKLEI